MIATSDSGEVILVAGRQVRTREGLEVLALGTRRVFPDGKGLGATLRQIRQEGALAVVPWGFGKWWFRRGTLVADLLRFREAGVFFLGDNAGRPRSSPPSRLFTEAARRGVLVLPGSDPLPFEDHADKAGSYGFVMPHGLEAGRPAATLKERLGASSVQPLVFGARRGTCGFVRDQIRMRSWRRGSVTA